MYNMVLLNRVWDVPCGYVTKLLFLFLISSASLEPEGYGSDILISSASGSELLSELRWSHPLFQWRCLKRSPLDYRKTEFHFFQRRSRVPFRH